MDTQTSGPITTPPATLQVSLSDFPVFDGLTDPDGFIRQCERLAHLGGIGGEQLQNVITARCRGLALQVLETGGDQSDPAARLRAAFGSKRSELAVTQLSAAVKGDKPVLEYAMTIKDLVRGACPEFFDQNGNIKKTCVPAYQAALYRHFVTGLSSEEKLLLSRQGATSFDSALDELRREEIVTQSIGLEGARPSTVHWADWGAVSSEIRRIGHRSSSSPGSRRQQDRRFDRFEDEEPTTPERYARAVSRTGGRAGSRPHTSWQGRRRSWSSGRSPGGSRGGGARHWSGRRSAAAREPSTSSNEDGRRSTQPEPERRRDPQCWSCRGFGHLKRDCPNGRPGRRGGMW